MRWRAATLLVALSLSIVPVLARNKPAPTAPGSYKEWGPDIDEMEIVQTFKIADYSRVVVLPFDTSETPLPDPRHRSYETIRAALDGYTLTLVEALKPELKAKLDVSRAEIAPKTANTVIVRGKVLELNPGSRAKRYFVGYGAGATGTKVRGEIVDARSGEVLARFTQERRSGGTWKPAGGRDIDVMRDSIHAVGQDIAHVLDAF